MKQGLAALAADKRRWGRLSGVSVLCRAAHPDFLPHRCDRLRSEDSDAGARHSRRDYPPTTVPTREHRKSRYSPYVHLHVRLSDGHGNQSSKRSGRPSMSGGVLSPMNKWSLQPRSIITLRRQPPGSERHANILICVIRDGVVGRRATLETLEKVIKIDWWCRDYHVRCLIFAMHESRGEHFGLLVV